MAIVGIAPLVIEREDIDRLGVRHLELSKIWEPTGKNLSPIQVLAQRPAAPEVPGMAEIGQSTIRHVGHMQTMWTFEGWSNDPKIPFRNRENSIEWGFEPGFSERSLQLHKSWQKFVDTYGATIGPDGSIQWPQTISGGGGGTGFGGGGGGTDEQDNPLYGYQTYFSMAQASWMFEYVDLTIPSSFFDRVGEILESSALPGNPPQFGTRNWLKLPIKFRRRGLMLQFTEIYWLSGEGGWPAPVYDHNQING